MSLAYLECPLLIPEVFKKIYKIKIQPPFQVCMTHVYVLEMVRQWQATLAEECFITNTYTSLNTLQRTMLKATRWCTTTQLVLFYFNLKLILTSYPHKEEKHVQPVFVYLIWIKVANMKNGLERGYCNLFRRVLHEKRATNKWSARTGSWVIWDKVTLHMKHALFVYLCTRTN